MVISRVAGRAAASARYRACRGFRVTTTQESPYARSDNLGPATNGSSRTWTDLARVADLERLGHPDVARRALRRPCRPR
jgi:hypothetical protein